jgi:hypothetical protein
MRKVNEMVKRIRLAIVNVCVLGHLRSKMPYFFFKESTQQKLIDELHIVFETVRRQYDLAEGDFPKIDEFRAALRLADFSTFPHTKREVLVSLQDMLTVDIPRIIAHVAGVVKEGPGLGGDYDDEAETPAVGPSNLQPKLFTLPEINSSNMSIVVVASILLSVVTLLSLTFLFPVLRGVVFNRTRTGEL